MVTPRYQLHMLLEELCLSERSNSSNQFLKDNKERKQNGQQKRSGHHYSILQLPGETRNQVYKLALTHISGKLYCWRRTTWYNGQAHHSFRVSRCKEPKSRHIDFNQLKFTCHQLYRETVDLETKFNTIIFTCLSLDQDRNIPIPDFLLYTSQCAGPRLCWLRTVILDYDKVTGLTVPEPAVTIAKLAHFCRRTPHVMVKYLFNVEGRSRCTHPWYIPYLMRAYVFFNLALRDLHVAPRIVLQPFQVDEATRWRSKSSAAEMEAPNLRFFLADWDEQALERWLYLAPQYQYGEMVRDWIQNGI
ncbi:hypothetical protein BDV96DRAFT_599692 [Lophiotrema nucula]|uniref:Uncharacterized protein n=1 Tax=Lophiotrema nucula TaxID=690887 RepID=A0A6A5ZAB9_9PLEO|nr:hypothetical protein BDV96DRAFT_599692 [Lophiotrema nucula]